ncbi:MAG: TolC family protein [Pseudomonadota bacterium]
MSAQFKTAALGLLILVLSGCAGFSADGGREALDALTRERGGAALALGGAELDSERAALLAALPNQPLTVEAAVRLAVLNNRGLQADLAELGISEAELVQAGRLRNPGLSFSRLSDGAGSEIERAVVFDLAGLLTLPMRRKIERDRFEQTVLRAAGQVVQLAADTRRAWITAVAAAQTAAYMEQASSAAEAAAELAQGMARAGNWSRLDQVREQAFYADTMAQVGRARLLAGSSREKLVRLLGLWGTQTAFSVPDRLPELPASVAPIADVEARAMARRLDIQIGKREAEQNARALGLSRVSGIVNVLELGYANKSATGQPRENGYQIGIELPIFDGGGAHTAKARARYMQTLHRTADIAIAARSQVREAHAAYRGHYELARHYRDQVVPLRKKISDEVMLRYNGMLLSVFELLTDAREQVASVNGAIDAQRDFWLAETDLHAAMGGATDQAPPSSNPSHQE